MTTAATQRRGHAPDVLAIEGRVLAPSERQGRWRIPVAVAAVTFLFLPLVTIASGFDARPIENRPLHTFPSLRHAWSSLDEIDAALTDRIPQRERAVRADAWIDQHLFGDNPTIGQSADPQVLLGKAGWLFLAGEYGSHCHPAQSPEATVELWRGAMAEFERMGKPAVLLVAPDKSSVYPEFLPDVFSDEACGETNRDQLWKELRVDPPLGFFDMRELIETEKPRRREPLYFPKDTHWNPLGAALAVQQVIEALDADAWADARIVRGTPGPYVGDLTNLIGAPEEDDAVGYTVVLDGAPKATARKALTDIGVEKMIWRGGDTAPIKGRTLLYYDSFGVRMVPQLAPFFEELHAVEWFRTGVSDLGNEVEESDTVILETVERDLYFRGSARLTPEAFDDLREIPDG